MFQILTEKVDYERTIKDYEGKTNQFYQKYNYPTTLTAVRLQMTHNKDHEVNR